MFEIMFGASRITMLRNKKCLFSFNSVRAKMQLNSLLFSIYKILRVRRTFDHYLHIGYQPPLVSEFIKSTCIKKSSWKIFNVTKIFYVAFKRISLPKTGENLLLPKIID